MKTIYSYLRYQPLKGIVIVFILLMTYACDSFTEVDIPKSELTGASVYQDITTAKSALADIYARLREGGLASGTLTSGTSLMANYSDDMDFYGSNTDVGQFNNHTMLSSNTTLLRLWNTVYSEIYVMNAFIEGVQASSSITGEDRNRLLGETLFLRAFTYFYLVNYFGDIPYVTGTDYEINMTLAKTPSVQVWQKIIQDLLEAEALLPESYPTQERVRTNKSAVWAMLSRTYLYTGNYEQAEIYATSVINSGLYTIEPNPAMLFLKNSPSIIWAFHSGMAGLNTKDASTFTFSSGPPSKPALSASLYNAFESGDNRKSLWVLPVTNSNGTWYRPYKYKQTSSTSPSQEYTIILRLEEQYLIRAEARTMTNNILGSQQDLNVTRIRAGLPSTTATTQTELMTAILEERRLEFFTEQSHRWFDLKRTGNAAAVLNDIKPGWQVRNIVLPLPESELLLNENLLPQNSGY